MQDEKYYVSQSCVTFCQHDKSLAFWKVEITFPRTQSVWALQIQEDEQQQIYQNSSGLQLLWRLLEKIPV